MAWTMAQQAAIDKRDANILVSAAAGSGKTAVLTERVFNRILGNSEEEGIDIDRFLIVTFTSAAANEMKERVGDKISERIEELQNKEELTLLDKEQMGYLERQLSLLSKASISTIHSFCLKTIKAYFNNLEIDPNIRVGNDAELTIMKLEILEEMLEEYFEQEDNEEFLKLADTYGGVRGMEPLIQMILDVHTFSKSTVFPNEWLEEKANLLCEDYESLDDSPWGEALAKDILFQLQDLRSLYKEALKLCKKPMGPALYEDILLADLSQIERVEDGPLSEIIDNLSQISFGRLPGKKQECDERLKDRVKGYRDIAKKIVGEIKSSTIPMQDPTLLRQTPLVGQVIKGLVGLVGEFDTRYGEQKRERGLVDYNDLEHMCLKLLITRDEVDGQIGYTETAKELSSFYKEVYIDEYQDSNMVQETILGAVAAAKEDGPTKFMVGDMKQSIYRFRLANPLIFAKKYDTWHKYIREGEIHENRETKNVCIDLSQNFRSRENILAATNDIFDQIMSKDVGDLVYDEDAKLKVGNFYADGDCADIEGGLSDCVELHILETDKIEEVDEGSEEEGEDLKSIELEANMVATLIDELLQGKGNPSHVFDKGIGDYRKVDPKDIVILLRAKSNASIFEEALLAKGIDAYAEVNSSFFEALEIQTMISLLQIVDNPMQDIPLITVLRSPIVGVSLDDLVHIRKEKENGDFYSALKCYIQKEEAKESIKYFYNLLGKYREIAATITIEELLARLFVETGYYRYVGVLPAGAKKKANLRMLKKYAEEFESTSQTGLFNFIQYLERLSQTNANLEQAKLVGANENLVRIMSIHKSKGLEFPVVFLSETSKKFNNQDIKNNLLFHSELGFGPRHLDYEDEIIYDTIPFVVLKNKIVSENLSEEMRILYVALTRAKEKLIITGTVKNLEKQVDNWSKYGIRSAKGVLPLGIKKSATYLNWIGISLFAHKGFEEVRQVIDEKPEYLFEASSRWKLKKWTGAEIALSNRKALELLENKKSMIQSWDAVVDYSGHKKEIFEKLNFSYSHRESTILPTKVSVSELKKNKKENWIKSEGLKAEEKSVPSFIRQPAVGVQGAARGTMIHKIFEQLDYLQIKDKEGVREELYKLASSRKIDEQVLEIINIDTLVSMANSEMAGRMRSAKYMWKEKAFVYLTQASEVDDTYPEDEEILVQGVVDACFIEEDGFVIVDYKTDYIDLNNIEESILKIKDRYEIQLDLYAQAISLITNKPIKEKVIYLYNIDRWITLCH
ncbi:MAG: helicase-exonuclease AddAB subunit AddA [Cellulosilyticaceae bacterium]